MSPRAVLARPSCAALVALAALAGCGSRSPLDVFDAIDSSASGTGGTGAGGGGGVAPPCAAWEALHDPLQVSAIPSIVGLQALFATPEGALVGFSDEQLPVVDPSWHARAVNLDFTLGEDHAVLQRAPDAFEYTGISFAESNGVYAAIASDESVGVRFATIDSQGAPLATAAPIAGFPGRSLLPLGSGFSALRSDYDNNGQAPSEVDLLSLSARGDALATSTLRPASPKPEYPRRVGFPDGSFLLTSDSASRAQVIVQHFSPEGAALAQPTVLQSFPNTYTTLEVLTGDGSILLLWTERAGAHFDLFSAPFDANGVPRGAKQRFARASTDNLDALAGAAMPGGFVVGWIEGIDSTSNPIFVQGLAADGTPVGAAHQVGVADAGSSPELLLAVSPIGAVAAYVSDVPGDGIEVFALPLGCAD